MKLHRTDGGVIAEGPETTMQDLVERLVREGVSLAEANLNGAILTDANLNGADLYSADLSGAILTGAILTGAKLNGAIFRYANLYSADLRGAILTRADLSGADLRGADLSCATLFGATLRGTWGLGSLAEEVMGLRAAMEELRKRVVERWCFDFREWIERHWLWSQETFGPAEERGPEGPADHLRREVEELNKNPWDLEEISDIIHLAVDGALRGGHTIRELFEMLYFKQNKNHARDWPDWRDAPKGKAIEHIREGEEQKLKDQELVFCCAPHPQEPLLIRPCDRPPGHSGDHRGRSEGDGSPYGSNSVFWRGGWNTTDDHLRSERDE